MRIPDRDKIPALFILIASFVLPAAAQQKPPRDYPVKPVPFTAVHFTDTFWAPKLEVNRKVTIPFAFKKDEESKRIYHFERAGAVLRGENIADKTPPGYPFDDTDVYKVIEGAAYSLSVHPDAELEKYVDALVDKIGAAQEPDGYLYTTRTIDPVNPHKWAGKERWELEKVDSHELYNLGHLYEAATAYYQATGKRKLLDIALKTADLLDKTFGPGKRSIWPGHQITEMGLVKLYRVTGDARYLNLAKFLLDQRGPDGAPGAGRTYNQSHKKVTEQSEAVGHAVRATYMYSGMADVAALTGDRSYVDAIDRIWNDVAGRKLYITGGIGARDSGEAFGDPYELPNMSAYNETCAAVGNDLWNERLFLLHADAKYVDIMERTLYNGLISGVSLDGRSFFYPNPLESAGQHERSPWFGVACCPGNITRLLPSVPGYVYAQRGSALYVNLYAASSADIRMDNGRKVKVVQETRYPWDGAIKLKVDPERPGRMTINLRIPGWARNEPVPGGLYRFLDKMNEPVTILVNGAPGTLRLEKGYAAITRQWKKGDEIELRLPMPVRRIVADEQVRADRDKVALQRGPLVYAAEWVDNPGGRVRSLMLPDDSKLTTEFRPDLLGGVQVIRSKAISLAYDEQRNVIKKDREFTAIPYYAWANRGAGEMMVWLPRTESSARPQQYPTIASSSKVAASANGRNLRSVNEQEEPSISSDDSASFFYWRSRGATEWVEYTFEKPATVSETSVYWYDDAEGFRVPKGWRLLFKDGDDWRPVETVSVYATEKDRYNIVSFKAVATTGLRLEATSQPEKLTGIIEWKVK